MNNDECNQADIKRLGYQYVLEDNQSIGKQWYR